MTEETVVFVKMADNVWSLDPNKNLQLSLPRNEYRSTQYTKTPPPQDVYSAAEAIRSVAEGWITTLRSLRMGQFIPMISRSFFVNEEISCVCPLGEAIEALVLISFESLLRNCTIDGAINSCKVHALRRQRLCAKLLSPTSGLSTSTIDT